MTERGARGSPGARPAGALSDSYLPANRCGAIFYRFLLPYTHLHREKKKGFLWKEGSGLLLPLRARGREGRALLHSFAPRQMRSKIPAPGHTCCASSLPSCCCCCPNRSLQVVSGAPQVSGAASAAHSHQAMGFPPRAPHRPWYSAACGHCHLQRCAWPPRHCPPCPLHPGRGGRAAGSDQRGGGRPGAAALPVSKHTSNPWHSKAANTSWCKEGSPVPRAATSTREHPCVGCQTPGHPACTRARDCTYKDMSWPPKGLAGGTCIPCCHSDVFGFSQQQFPSLGDCK